CPDPARATRRSRPGRPLTRLPASRPGQRRSSAPLPLARTACPARSLGLGRPILAGTGIKTAHADPRPSSGFTVINSSLAPTPGHRTIRPGAIGAAGTTVALLAGITFLHVEELTPTATTATTAEQEHRNAEHAGSQRRRADVEYGASGARMQRG